MPPERDDHLTGAKPARDEVWAGMMRSSQGLRDLQRFLDGVKELGDAGFAEATGGTDRAEVMQLLQQLNKLLAATDEVTAQLHPDVN